MLYTPIRIDDFYRNLNKIQNDLYAIINGHLKWGAAENAACPLTCDENIRELDNFQSELCVDDYAPEEYDNICAQIERLHAEFLRLREDICIASLSDQDWWFNCLGSEKEYLTERLLNNVPSDFIKNNPYTLNADVSVNDLIALYTVAKATNFEYVLALASMARNGSVSARKFLLSELHIEIIPVEINHH